MDITYIDTKPWRAQLIANTYAEAFVASTVDKRFQANSFAKTFLDDQIKQLKIKMEELERALLNFAEQEKIVEANDKASIAENNLAAANTTLGQIISERIKNEQLWKQVQNATAINLPQLLSNSVIEVLRGQRRCWKPNIRKSSKTLSRATRQWCRYRTRSKRSIGKRLPRSRPDATAQGGVRVVARAGKRNEIAHRDAQNRGPRPAEKGHSK